MKAGEKRMKCLACDHEQVVGVKESALNVGCEQCRLKFMEVIRIRSSLVQGVGRNAVADLGLALLMEAGANAGE